MARVLVGELKQETATFNPWPTRYDDFRVHVGGNIVAAYESTRTELAGAFEVFREHQYDIVPTAASAAVSGGAIGTDDLNRLIQHHLDEAARATDIDGIYLCLHGAMAGQSEDDPEGLLLSKMREMFPSKPIVASLDLHAVLTDRMIQSADVLVPYHTYPHTDHYETGQRAARVLARLINGDARPTVARVPLPMLVRGDELLTATGRFGEAIRMCQEVESSESGLAAGVLIGNAFTDVPDLKSNVLITTNDNAELAEQTAEEIGRFLWRSREVFQAALTPLDRAIELAQQTDGLVVFSDAADATASGAAGDSNAILAGLLRSGFSKRSLLAIVDAPAVAAAWEAGVDAKIHTTLGGTRDAGRFQPLPIAATVAGLLDGGFPYEDGTQANSGRVAVLRHGEVHLLVTERPVYVVGQRVFASHGLNPAEFDLVVVKSPNGFRTWYESIASLIVAVDVPGSTSANLSSLPFRNCARPIFPLDPDVPSPFSEESS